MFGYFSNKIKNIQEKKIRVKKCSVDFSNKSSVKSINTYNSIIETR